MMDKGNRQSVYQNLQLIIEQFQNGTSVTALCKQYHVAYETMRTAIATVIDDDEYHQICRRHLLRGGVKTRFSKGHQPYNKNIKGIHLSPATEFKKGHLPASHKPVGTITLRRNKPRGYVLRMIKVSGLKEGSHKWIPLATWIWEQSYGPVPRGFFVVHADGDTLNDVIDNYEIATRAEHLRRIKERGGERMEKCRIKTLRAASKRRWRRYWKRQRQLEKEAKKAADERKKFKVQDVAEQNKFEPMLKAAQRPPMVIWMCSSCGYTYPGDAPPHQCTKCSRGGFERNVIPRRMDTSDFKNRSMDLCGTAV